MVYLSPSAGSDGGECTRSAPCATLPFAVSKVSANRPILRIESGEIVLSSAFTFSKAVEIDAQDTVIRLAATGTGPVLNVTDVLGNVGLAHVRVTTNSGTGTVAVSNSATLRLFDATAGVTVSNAALDARRSILGFGCTDGTVSADQTSLTGFDTIRCQLTVTRSRLADGRYTAEGGFVRIENNLVTESDGIADAMLVRTAAPGSTVRYNTFVSTQATPSDGTALGCDATVDVTSNVFAYNSGHPMGPSCCVCAARYSLFDAVAVAQHTAGEGNKVADGSTFFVDQLAKDFHLTADSPAKAMAEPGVNVATDLDGRTRPQPVGSVADVGCFEAP